MAYEIPQELAYQEKIIFGLTMKQLWYALIFSPIVLFILFKLQMEMAYRIAIATIPSSIAAIFMFTPLPKKFINWFKWLRFRKVSLKDPKMKKFFNLKKIRNDKLFLKDRTLSIIKVDPINFAIKNQKEKDIVIVSFQKFLNSLDFPIQIVVATDSLNLDYYLNKLGERVEDDKNKSYSSLFTNYKKHLESMIKTKNLLNNDNIE